LESYFLNQGRDNCDPEIWKYVKDQEDGFSSTLTIPECYIHLSHHIMNVFHKSIKQLETNTFSPFQLYSHMSDLRISLQTRKEDKFCGMNVQNALKTCSAYEKVTFLADLNLAYTRA